MLSFSTVAGATLAFASLSHAWPGPWNQNQAPSAVGRHFQIDGKVQYFAGTNSWWLGHLYYDADVQTAAQEISQSGLKVSRVWGFGNANVADNSSIYYQLINETAGGPYSTSINYGTNGIARLDSAIKYAEQYNLKLVLNFLNNWDDLGGINTYCNVFGCNATTFYTNQAAQAAYKNYIKFIVNRYKNSNAVFAWELCNEPRCHGCDSSVIYNWASETSAYIKSLDNSHLVTLGDEGWLCAPTAEGTEGYYPNYDGSYAYSCIEGVDFAKNLKIPTLDYGTFHMYPDGGWGYNYTWGNEWIKQHDIIGAAAGKPVVLEEYGAIGVGSGEIDTSGGQTANSTLVEAQWQQTVLTQTEIAYDSFWQFSSHNLPDGENDADVYGIYYGTPEYQLLAVQHAQQMDAKPVWGPW